MFFINIFWWVLFFIIAIILQKFLVGVDILLVGLIITLQEKKIIQFFWVFLLATLIHEGAGNLAFGYSVLWYITGIFVFYGAKVLFEERNFLFITLFSCVISLAHYFYIHVFSGLEGLVIANDRLITESIWQAVLIPLLWLPAYYLRLKTVKQIDQ